MMSRGGDEQDTRARAKARCLGVLNVARTLGLRARRQALAPTPGGQRPSSHERHARANALAEPERRKPCGALRSISQWEWQQEQKWLAACVRESVEIVVNVIVTRLWRPSRRACLSLGGGHRGAQGRDYFVAARAVAD